MTGRTRNQALLRPRTGVHWALLGLAAGLLYAFLGFVATEPLSWWPFAPLSLLPLFAIALVGSRAPRRTSWRVAAGVWVGSLPLWVITHAWISGVSPVGFVPGMLLQGSWAGFFVLLACSALRSRQEPLGITMTLALVWSFVEIFRGSILFGGYAWLLVGHPMIEAAWIARSGAVVGAYGVGFALALSMGALISLGGTSERRVNTVGIAVVPWLVLAGLGWLAPGLAEPSGARAAIIQTNVPQDNRIAWSIEDQVAGFERFASMTRTVGDRADFIVWPETMLPGPPISPQAIAEMERFGLAYQVELPDRDRLEGTYFAESAIALQQEVGVPMIVGATGVDNLRLSVSPEGLVSQDDDGFYNSAHVFVGGGLAGERYDKLRLTIFGEVLPLVSRWDWLEEKLLLIGAGGMAFDLDAGRAPVWFNLPSRGGTPLRVATPICFEVAYSGVCRRLAGGGGDRIDAFVNLTNDGWFGTSDAGRAMHLKHARWRSLETGIPMVRAANTGISTIIDARGGVVPVAVEHPEGEGTHRTSTGGQTFATRTAAVVIGDVPPRTRSATPFARVGHLFPWLLVLGGLWVLLHGLVTGPRAPRA
ncbi:MAG: apolipoprotein N-acyltransferase [Phycisphaerales bacterium]|nr:apolipoprotein N-acyltransferase [Phycisphaerales bacterium]